MGWLDDLMGELTWLAKSHQQMYDDIHGGVGVSGGHETLDHYNRADVLLADIQLRIEKGVKDLSENWSGAAAEGATALTNASAEWAQAASVATVVARAQGLQQSSAFVDARNGMPEPVPLPDISPKGGFPAAKLGLDFVAAKGRADAAHREAVRIMTGYQASTSEHIKAMPQYPPVGTTVASTVVVPAAPGGDIGSPLSVPGRSPAGQPPPGAERPGTRQPGPAPQPPVQVPAHAPVQRGPEGPVQGLPPGRSAPQPPNHEMSSPTNERLAGRQPGTSTSTSASPTATPSTGGLGASRQGGGPATGSPTGFRPLGGGTGFVGGGPTGSNPTGPNPTGNPGNSGIGQRGQGGPVRAEPVAGGASARGAAGARGTAGTQGMVPVGPGGSHQDEDEEHQRKYVVLDDQHLVDDSPPTAPSVIGEDRY